MSLLHSYLDDKKYTYDYFYQDNVCRLCWSGTNIIIYLENNSRITRKILEITGIDITAGIPNKVCNICLRQIKKFVYFKQRCQEAERKLKIILANDFEDNHDDVTILSNEADLELQLLAQEMKSESIDGLIIKEEADDKFNVYDSVCDYCDPINDLSKDFLFPKDEGDLIPKDEDVLSPEGKNNLFQEDSNLLSIDDGQLFKDNNLLKDINDELSKDGEFPKHSNCFNCSVNFDIVENNNESQRIKENTSYKCHGCKKVFLSFAHNTDHEVRLCKAINKFSYNLNKRKKEKKQGKQERSKCVCEICGQSYSRNNMSIHMAIHTRKKQLKCPHCDYRATLQASLNTHIKSHTGEKPFACDKCPYRCITRSNLNKHLKTHTNEKEYKCHICNKSYRYNVSLRDHITTAHEGEKKHKCKQCGIEYFHFKGLRKHLLIKHGLKVKKVKDDFVEVDELYQENKKNKGGG